MTMKHEIDMIQMLTAHQQKFQGFCKVTELSIHEFFKVAFA